MAVHFLQHHNLKVDRCSVDCIRNALIRGNRAGLYKFLRENFTARLYYYFTGI